MIYLKVEPLKDIFLHFLIVFFIGLTCQNFFNIFCSPYTAVYIFWIAIFSIEILFIISSFILGYYFAKKVNELDDYKKWIKELYNKNAFIGLCLLHFYFLLSTLTFILIKGDQYVF